MTLTSPQPGSAISQESETRSVQAAGSQKVIKIPSLKTGSWSFTMSSDT